MTTDAADAEVRTLPRTTRRNHRWIERKTILPDDSVSGCEETHRQCEHCPLIRITVHPPHGLPYRLWQYRDGERADGLTPMCEGEGSQSNGA